MRPHPASPTNAGACPGPAAQRPTRSLTSHARVGPSGCRRTWPPSCPAQLQRGQGPKNTCQGAAAHPRANARPCAAARSIVGCLSPKPVKRMLHLPMYPQNHMAPPPLPPARPPTLPTCCPLDPGWGPVQPPAARVLQPDLDARAMGDGRVARGVCACRAGQERGKACLAYLVPTRIRIGGQGSPQHL